MQSSLRQWRDLLDRGRLGDAGMDPAGALEIAAAISASHLARRSMPYAIQERSFSVAIVMNCILGLVLNG
jgi:hypothetical protein